MPVTVPGYGNRINLDASPAPGAPHLSSAAPYKEVGAALQNLGNQVAQTGVAVARAKQRQDEVEAQDAALRFQSEWQERMTQDDEETGRQGYLNRQGKNTADLVDEAEREYQDLMDKHTQDLSPAQLAVMERFRLRHQTSQMSTVAKHMSRQMDAYADETTESLVSATKREALIAYQDEESFKWSMDSIRGARTAQAKRRGWSDRRLANQLIHDQGEILAGRTERLLDSGDPFAADKLLQQHRDRFMPDDLERLAPAVERAKDHKRAQIVVDAATRHGFGPDAQTKARKEIRTLLDGDARDQAIKWYNGRVSEHEKGMQAFQEASIEQAQQRIHEVDNLDEAMAILGQIRDHNVWEAAQSFLDKRYAADLQAREDVVEGHVTTIEEQGEMVQEANNSRAATIVREHVAQYPETTEDQATILYFQNGGAHDSRYLRDVQEFARQGGHTGEITGLVDAISRRFRGLTPAQRWTNDPVKVHNFYQEVSKMATRKAGGKEVTEQHVMEAYRFLDVDEWDTYGPNETRIDLLHWGEDTSDFQADNMSEYDRERARNLMRRVGMKDEEMTDEAVSAVHSAILSEGAGAAEGIARQVRRASESYSKLSSQVRQMVAQGTTARQAAAQGADAGSVFQLNRYEVESLGRGVEEAKDAWRGDALLTEKTRQGLIKTGTSPEDLRAWSRMDPEQFNQHMRTLRNVWPEAAASLQRALSEAEAQESWPPPPPRSSLNSGE
ncbi:MAG: hypothetical protein ACOC00_00120 [Halothiobacillaceae bacterium]